MNQDHNMLSVYAHNGDEIGSIALFPAPQTSDVFGSRGEVRRFNIVRGRRQLLQAWERWAQLILRSPQNEALQVVVAIVAFPTGRDGEGYLRFL
jgi:hypothetical protein